MILDALCGLLPWLQHLPGKKLLWGHFDNTCLASLGCEPNTIVFSYLVFLQGILDNSQSILVKSLFFNSEVALIIIFFQETWENMKTTQVYIHYVYILTAGILWTEAD